MLSLITWALIIVVTLKYVVVVMRADNHGEGGVLALMALVLAASGLSAAPAADLHRCWASPAPRCSTATAC